MNKKIIAVLMIVCLCVASTFAFGLGAGVKGNLGWNVGAGDSIVSSFSSIDKNSAFDFGGGAYVYMSFLPFLGVQAEANLISSSVTFSSVETGDVQKYEQLLLDLTPMLWSVYDFWIFQLAFGVGPNFSIGLAQLGDITSASWDQFTVGLGCGADFKIFFGEHFGLVLGGRFICEWNQTNVAVTVADYDTGASYPEVSFYRRSFYGSVGVELKI